MTLLLYIVAAAWCVEAVWFAWSYQRGPAVAQKLRTR